MEDKSAQIEKKLEDIEKRLAALEKQKTIQASVSPKSDQIPIIIPQVEEKEGPPILAFISLIIGAVITWNFLPSLFFGYGYGGFGLFQVVILGIGLAFSGFGLKTILERRKKPAATVKKEELVGAVKSPAESTSVFEQKIANVLGSGQSLEFNVASHWFSIVGVIAIILGVVFFLKYAFDNNLIGPVGQVSVGVIIGLVLLAGGEYFRKKYQGYSQILTGGGILVLYLAIWASFSLFHLLSDEIVLAAMSLITLTAALLSIRYVAFTIAILGIVGGFVTPILISEGFANQMLLMGYIIILNLGVLLIAIYQNWLKLKLLSFVATYIVFFSWYTNFYKSPDLWTTELFLTILFLIFGLVYFIYNVVNKKVTEETDVLLMLGNAAVYFTFSYSLLKADYSNYLGFFALGLAAFYFLLGYYSFIQFKQDSPLTLGFLGISIVFLTIAVPLQVKKNLITIVWAFEGLILLWGGFWLNSYKLRIAALFVYLLVGGRLLLFDTNIPVAEFTLIANKRFLTFVIGIVSAGLASWLYFKFKEKVTSDEAIVLPSLLIALNLLLIWAVSWESISYFGRKIDNVERSGVISMADDERVLALRTVNSKIRAAEEDISVGCNKAIDVEIFVGFDISCTPPTKYVSGLKFAYIQIPQNSIITRATLELYSAVTILPSYIGLMHYIDPSNNILTVDKLLEEWTNYSSIANSQITESLGINSYVLLDVTANIQFAVKSSQWQNGSSIVIILDSPNSGQVKFSSFESSPQFAANLTINYDDLSTFKQFDQSTPSATEQNLQYITPYNSPYQQPDDYQKSILRDPKVLDKIKGLESARDVSLSIIWLVYSIILTAIGILAKYKPIRLFAMAFLVITIVKVFLFDSRNLEQGYRIIAFMVLGVILLVVSLIYQKYKSKIEAFLLNG